MSSCTKDSLAKQFDELIDVFELQVSRGRVLTNIVVVVVYESQECQRATRLVQVNIE